MHIEHVPAYHRFVARLPEGDAILTYRVMADGGWDIRSTYVPPAARGRGTGGALVQTALAHARSEGRLVVPTCWYVGAWVAKHPEFCDVVVTGSMGSA